MKYIYLIIAFALSSLAIQAQPDVPLTFEGIQPEWDHYLLVPGHEKNLQAFYFYKEVRFVDNDPIIVSVISDSTIYQGPFVQRLVSETGMPLWTFYRYFPYSTSDRAEVVADSYINIKDNTLVLPFVTKDNKSIAGQAYIGRRTLDIESGMMIDSIGSDPNDPFNIPVPTFFIGFNPDSKNCFHTLTDTTISHLKLNLMLVPDTLSLILRQNTLNMSGHILSKADSVRIDVPLGFQLPYEYKITKVGENRNLWFAAGYYTTPHDNDFCYITLVDDLLNVLEPPVNIADKLSVTRSDFRAVWHDENRVIILTRSYDESKNIYFQSVDFKGNILQTYSIENEEVKKLKSYKVIPFLQDKILVCGVEYFNNKHHLNFYMPDEDNYLHLKKRISINSALNNGIGIFEILPTPDNQILINLVHKDILDDDWAPKWNFWVKFDPTQLGLTTRTKDYITSSLKLYPNPTTNILQIEGLTSPADIRISDLNGVTVRMIKNAESSVNIGDLPDGVYIFDIKNKDVSERHKIVKIR